MQISMTQNWCDMVNSFHIDCLPVLLDTKYSIMDATCSIEGLALSKHNIHLLSIWDFQLSHTIDPTSECKHTLSILE